MGVSGSVTLRTSSANVTVKGIKGDLISDVGSANMHVADADGLINVTTTTGNLEVENAGGDVRVVSINGRTKIHCAKGHVDVSDTSGVTTLTGIGGDVDVMTSSGRASLTGALRAGGRYRLRTLSGAVQMIVPSDAVNFGVTLSLPSIVGRGGVLEVLQPEMTDEEQAGLKKSAETLRQALEVLRHGLQIGLQRRQVAAQVLLDVLDRRAHAVERTVIGGVAAG